MRENGMAELVAMSNRYGSDPGYVLANGGNTSLKENGTLWVKGSGTALGTITAEQFVVMDMGKLTAILERDYPAEDAEREAAVLSAMAGARLPGEEGKRPSVEAILHALFPYQYVLHTHPALVNGLTCGNGGEALAGELLPKGTVWIPLTKPGYLLSAVCRDALEKAAKAGDGFPKVLLLQNHGLFVAADSVAEIDAIMADIMERLRTRVVREPDFSEADFDRQAACALAPALRTLYGGEDGKAAAVFCGNREARAFARDAAALAPLTAPLTPDHIVYCKHTPLWVKPETDLAAAFAAYREAHGFAPKIVAAEGLGFFALGQSKKEADTALALLMDALRVTVYAESFGGVRTLPEDFTRFILNWEAESYRQKTGLSGKAAGRMDGKVALVTGSAQGFGRGIAQALAAEGAYLVIADLNGDGAKECAAALEAAHGAGRALAVTANVGDEASVEAMVQAAVLYYGGLDVLISNAGIVISGGLEEMTREKFELVTRVNYTGYFLCARYAARPMRIQRRYRPDKWLDIIEVNSKSGLEGSNRNFAYAGSKFGGIGLTQSLALELVADGIKVNAVCPGNLLDGPLWSDPEKGLFRQYLDAGKVPGAKTLSDVRRFYEGKVPMGRGCTTEDVARAILYLVEQEYETGQALPVTGGQVMLK